MQADPRGEVVAALKQFEGRLEVINVDSAGIGWNMYTHLNDLFPGVTHPIKVGESPHDSEKYANLKAELYCGLRMRAQAGDLSGPPWRSSTFRLQGRGMGYTLSIRRRTGRRRDSRPGSIYDNPVYRSQLDIMAM